MVQNLVPQNSGYKYFSLQLSAWYLSDFINHNQKVAAQINLTAIRNALTGGNNENFKVVELENLIHLFQECETGSMSEYKEL